MEGLSAEALAALSAHLGKADVLEAVPEPVSNQHMFAVEHVEGKGMGVIAQEEIPAGTLLVQDASPLVFFETDSSNEEEELNQHFARLQLLDPDRAARMMELSDCWQSDEKPKSPWGVFYSNCLSSGDHRCVASVACRFNHSCSPNCQWSMNVEAGGRIDIFSSCTIPAGEELCITYIDTRATTTLRREQLERKFGFVCQCSICVAGNAQSDARRTSMLAVDAMVTVHCVESNVPEAMQATDQLLTLYAEEGITEPLLEGKVHFYRFQLHEALGQVDLAKESLYLMQSHVMKTFARDNAPMLEDFLGCAERYGIDAKSSLLP